MLDSHRKNLVAALQGSNARKKLRRIHDKRYQQVLVVHVSMYTQVPRGNPNDTEEEKS